MTRTALTVGIDTETSGRLAPALGGSGVDVDHVPLARDAASVLAQRRFDLVVCRYPLPDMLLREFVDVVRRPNGSKRDTALMVVTVPEMESEAALALRGLPARVTSSQAPMGRVREVVHHLLRLAPRRMPSEQVPAILDVCGRSLEYTVVNVSRTGMLLAGTTEVPLGSSCAFAVGTGESRVEGTAEIVRRTRRRTEWVEGVAVRFTGLEDGHRELLDERLAAWV